jgi:hypothetical protein
MKHGRNVKYPTLINLLKIPILPIGSVIPYIEETTLLISYSLLFH